MKKAIFFLTLLLATGAPVLAQKLEKPKLTSQPPTPAQEALIREGVTLYDAKKYDEAIKKYEQVLQENPDCTLAMYELALTYYNKPGDRPKAETLARKAAQYKSPQLALFYSIIASQLDDSGKSDEAVEIFKDAVKFLKNDKTLSSQLAEVNYNLGVTYFRRKEYDLSRAALKEGVAANFGHPGANFLLAEVFLGTKYKFPALMAAMRFLSFDQPNAARTRRAAAIITQVLKKPTKDEKTGNIQIFMDLGAPKDEGEYGMYDLLGSITGIATDEDKAEKKTDNEMFVDSVESIISFLSDDKKLRSMFVGKTYIPYLASMKKAGHHETVAYIALAQSGNVDASKWIADNPKKLVDLYEWARAYEPQGK